MMGDKMKTNAAKIMTSVSKSVYFVIDGEQRFVLFKDGNEYRIYSSGMRKLGFDDIVTFLDIFLRVLPNERAFLEQQVGLTVADCRVMIDEWVKAVALYQKCH